MVCGCHCAQHQSRDFTEKGVRIDGTGRETQVLGLSGKPADGSPYLCHHWFFSVHDARSKVHTHARTLRCVSLYGRGVTQRRTAGAADQHLVHASKIPARLRVFTPRAHHARALVHGHPGGLPGASMVYQDNQKRQHCFSTHGTFHQ